jgi:hypothetical protein
MSDTADSILLYLLVVLFCFVPTAAAIELIAAIFSERVRAYILKHRTAHFIWFALALFLAVAMLVPAYSTRHGGF